MLPLLTAEEMRACEMQAIAEWGISSLVLQEHAAIGALALIPLGEPIHALAGPGNNGGDALALARLAKLQGRAVDVWALAPQKWKGDAAVQARLWEGIGGCYGRADSLEREAKQWHGWAVDGLFGLGTKLPLDINVEPWIEALNMAGRRFKVLALDLPTGLDPSSGEVAGLAAKADKTACFGHLKRCHGLRPAKDICGDIALVPIPLTKDPKCSLRLLGRPMLQKPDWNTHKYDLGHVAIRAGTKGMSGAAVLAALGALRGGAGLVSVFPDKDVAGLVAPQVPEAIVRPWEGDLPSNIDVLLVGPGGAEDVPQWNGPLVLDASALKPDEGPKWMARPKTILTPHAGEFSRLFGFKVGRGPQERLDAIEKLYGGMAFDPAAAIALKGAQTLVAGGGRQEVYVNSTGHSGLSSGGTGDYLAGLIAARFARGQEAPLMAAAQSVWLHGAAADRLGEGPLMVRELDASLAQILRELHIA
jgi:NAD(P)H-hydrate epimerase